MVALEHAAKTAGSSPSARARDTRAIRLSQKWGQIGAKIAAWRGAVFRCETGRIRLAAIDPGIAPLRILKSPGTALSRQAADRSGREAKFCRKMEAKRIVNAWRKEPMDTRKI